MADIPTTEILRKLFEHVEIDEAEVLLAVALDQLNLSVQASYTPAQVMAIGAAIADLQRQNLAAVEGVPFTKELDAAAGRVIDAVRGGFPPKR